MQAQGPGHRSRHDLHMLLIQDTRLFQILFEMVDYYNCQDVIILNYLHIRFMLKIFYTYDYSHAKMCVFVFF